MNYYTVPIIGDGSDDNPFRPDIPEGISFVGQFNDIDYLIATPYNIEGWSKAVQHMPRQELENACQIKGLAYDDVSKWSVDT